MPEEPRLFRTLRDDVGRVRTEVGHAGVGGAVGRTFRDLKEFYLSSHRQDRLASMSGVKKGIFFTIWLLKSLFLKLTPARRILLVICFVVIWNLTRWTGGSHGFRIEIAPSFLGVALLVFLLMLELKDKLLAREELEAGRAVQRALMPEGSPVIAGWDIWLFTRPANDVGGDLVDYLQIDAQRSCIVLGDVAGKGLPAALLMAKLQATLRALLPEFTSLAELGSRVNRILSRDGLPNRFATLVCVEVTPGSGHLRILNAGHPPPLILSATRGPDPASSEGGAPPAPPGSPDGFRVLELPPGSMALGFLPDAPFSEQAADIQPGETMIVYSDGVTEAMNTQGDFYGDDRFRAALPALARLPVPELGTRIVDAVDRFVRDAHPHDDLSLIVIRRA
jgi:sigma-B regulation protein RsbU (phosphoserine phosphatase)